MGKTDASSSPWIQPLGVDRSTPPMAAIIASGRLLKTSPIESGSRLYMGTTSSAM